jgi:hypothetical protein
MSGQPTSSEVNRRVTVLLKLDNSGAQTGSAQAPDEHSS